MEKKTLTIVEGPLECFMVQVQESASQLGFGRLIVEFRVVAGKVCEAHEIQRAKKLDPNLSGERYTSE